MREDYVVTTGDEGVTPEFNSAIERRFEKDGI
jgi:hypothetical protein